MESSKPRWRQYILLADKAYTEYLRGGGKDLELQGWYYTGYADGLRDFRLKTPKTFGPRSASVYEQGWKDGLGDRNA